MARVTFSCSLCDKRSPIEGPMYMVPLGPKYDSTAVRVCYRCDRTIRSYETMKALEAGEYDNVLNEKEAR